MHSHAQSPQDELTLFREAFDVIQGKGNLPFPWQEQLFQRFCRGDLPSALDLPTGLGKTSVMAIWLLARALTDEANRNRIPRRLVYVVDRRAVVDQATAEAEKLRHWLDGAADPKVRLGLGERRLPISTLRGQHLDNREWLTDPTTPAIVVGTVDMIGSRLLFSGYGVSSKMRPYHAGFLGADTLVVLDEAHLIPPFEALLKAIMRDSQRALGPSSDDDGKIVPRFRLISLSATGREEKEVDGGTIFRLVAHPAVPL
jgi:CRISPR-associated endonuclease/helicase Cas3